MITLTNILGVFQLAHRQQGSLSVPIMRQWLDRDSGPWVSLGQLLAMDWSERDVG
jgi:hypothetical protein